MGVKISQLPPVVAPALTDIFPIVQAGVTYKETVTQLAGLLTVAGSIPTYTFPSKADHIAVFSNGSGNLTQDISPAINGGSIQAGLSGTSGSFISFPATAATGSLAFTATSNSGDFNNIVTNASTLQAVTYTLGDPGTASAGFILTTSTVGQQIDLSTASATANLYSLYATLEATNATITAGTLTSLEGQVTMIGASGGNQFALLGNLVATGTLSSTAISAGLVGSLNLTGATINSGTISAVFAQFNGSAPTVSNGTNTSAIAVQNGTGLVLNSAISLTGSATNLLKNTGSPAYFATSGTSSGSWGNATPPTPSKVIAVNINSTTYYIPLVAQNT